MTKGANQGYWHAKWQQGDVKFHRDTPHPLLVKHFSTLNLAKGSYVFVPMCGKSEDMFWLVTQGMKVVGVELSQIAAQNFFAEHNMVPKYNGC